MTLDAIRPQIVLTANGWQHAPAWQLARWGDELKMEEVGYEKFILKDLIGKSSAVRQLLKNKTAGSSRP